ncbi:MAG: ribosome maturation factor RimP [Xanthomonadales bacterium]|nr:ribosome maturation factor RimP [Xanthomonadales bacterium]
MGQKERVEQLLKPLVEDLGYEFVGMELNAHSTNGLLRIYIDKPEVGIGLDDCELVSHEVSGLLDVHDPIKGQYRLEVSSPGLDRPLFTLDQFERFIDSEAKVTVMAPVDGRRRFKGRIVGVEEGAVVLEQDGAIVEIEAGNIGKARLVPTID